MAKNKGKNRKKKQSVSRKNEARLTLEDRTLRIDVLAMLPGILMSVMIILILTIDVVVSGMDKRQYTEFPGLFRIMFTISAVAGIIYFIIRMFRRDIELRSTQYGLTLTLFVIFLYASVFLLSLMVLMKKLYMEFHTGTQAYFIL